MMKDLGQPSKRWLMVSLRVPKSSADALSNFLMECGATGIEEDEEEQETERLKAYFVRDGREGSVLQSLRRYLIALAAIEPEISRAKIETETIPQQDWGERWKRFFKPFQVIPGVRIKPPWSSYRPRGDEIAVVLNPGMAFGTGTHATTRLCIRAMRSALTRKGLSVLDVGTGSGILSILAARMGAASVLGVDRDGLAVEIARDNVKENRVSRVVRIRRGSIGKVKGQFDLIVANIDLGVLRKMRNPLLRRLKRRGTLILSGLLEAEGERLRQFYLESGLLKGGRYIREEGWVCLTFQKK